MSALRRDCGNRAKSAFPALAAAIHADRLEVGGRHPSRDGGVIDGNYRGKVVDICVPDYHRFACALQRIAGYICGFDSRARSRKKSG
jgi:hypothetical protein